MPADVDPVLWLGPGLRSSASSGGGQRWSAPLELPTRVPLPEHEVHVWSVPLAVSDATAQSMAALLSAAESAHLERLRLQIHRRRFLVARSRLRQLISVYSGTPAAEVNIAVSPLGKPFLPSTNELQFNVSHSADWAAIAFATSPVGVDLECPDRSVDWIALAAHALSPAEATTLRALPASEIGHAFRRCWTCKEAYLKARGVGLHQALDSFSVSLDAARPGLVQANADPADPGRWAFATWVDDKGFAGAVTVDTSSRLHPLTLRRFCVTSDSLVPVTVQYTEAR